MLKWEDKQWGKSVRFETLHIGAPFEHDDFLYIKITSDEAFDIINYEVTKFQPAMQVVERDATITFH